MSEFIFLLIFVPLATALWFGGFYLFFWILDTGIQKGWWEDETHG